MDNNPTQTALRRANRKRRLGSDAACAHCGTQELECLQGRKLIEEHHAAGVAHDSEMTVPLCLNCHAKHTEAQLREGVPLKPQRTLPETVLAGLMSLAAFLRLLLDGFDRFIEMLKTTVVRLDASCPEWRDACAH